MRNEDKLLWRELTSCGFLQRPVSKASCYMLGNHHIDASYCEKIRRDPIGRIWGLLPPITMATHHDG